MHLHHFVFFFKTKKINKILKMAIWNHSFCGENLYMRWISDSNRWAHGMTSQHDNHFTNSPYGSGGWIWTTVLQIMRLSRWPDFSTPQYISKCFQQDSKNECNLTNIIHKIICGMNLYYRKHMCVFQRTYIINITKIWKIFIYLWTFRGLNRTWTYNPLINSQMR